MHGRHDVERRVADECRHEDGVINHLPLGQRLPQPVPPLALERSGGGASCCHQLIVACGLFATGDISARLLLSFRQLHRVYDDADCEEERVKRAQRPFEFDGRVAHVVEFVEGRDDLGSLHLALARVATGLLGFCLFCFFLLQLRVGRLVVTLAALVVAVVGVLFALAAGLVGRVGARHRRSDLLDLHGEWLVLAGSERLSLIRTAALGLVPAHGEPARGANWARTRVEESEWL